MHTQTLLITWESCFRRKVYSLAQKRVLSRRRRCRHRSFTTLYVIRTFLCVQLQWTAIIRLRRGKVSRRLLSTYCCTTHPHTHTRTQARTLEALNVRNSTRLREIREEQNELIKMNGRTHLEATQKNIHYALCATTYVYRRESHFINNDRNRRWCIMYIKILYYV